MSSTMRVWEQARYGGVEAMRQAERPVPEPGRGEIRVRVLACGINRSDWEMLTGRPAYARIYGPVRPPRGRVLGSDICGEVEALGEGVTGFAPGDVVLADLLSRFGGLAGHAVAPASVFVKVPAGIDPVTAAALPQSGGIVLSAFEGRLRPGVSVLVNGAGGGSGPLAVQMALAAGCRVAAVDNAAKAALLRDLGADPVIDYAAEDFAARPERYDLILDLWGTRGPGQVRRALAPGGRYMLVGGPLPVLLRVLVGGAVGGLGSDRKVGVLAAESGARHLPRLLELVQEGTLKPVIGEVAAMDDAPDALARMAEGRIAGKLVIVPEAA